MTAKSLADIFKGKTFAVYGIDVPKIVDVRSTSLPAIMASEVEVGQFASAQGGFICHSRL